MANREWKLTDDGWVISDEQPDNPKDDATYAALTSLRFISYAEIGRELGLDRSTIKRRLDKLVAMRVLKDQEVNDCFDRARELRRIDESALPGHSSLYSQLAEDNDGLFEDEEF